MNILTIDLEDWYQGFKMRGLFGWEKFQNSYDGDARITEYLLSVLQQKRVRATFFILGTYAEKHRELVKMIADEGHDIGTHGYSHDFVYRLTERQFEEDLKRSIATISGCIGSKEVVSYRAPMWSITRKSAWAIDVLARNGIKYDSSLYPFVTNRYGVMFAPTLPYRLLTASGSSLWEYPPSTVGARFLRLPFSGGIYFRLLPYVAIERAIRNVNSAGWGALIYLHPHDFDDKQPRLRAPLGYRVIKYSNLSRTKQKFEKMLDAFRFQSLAEFWSNAEVSRLKEFQI